jgi:hypothetical protein
MSPIATPLARQVADEEAGGGGPEVEEPTTREQHRSRRKRPVRARTISVKRMTKRELEMGRILNPETEEIRALRVQRPKTRGECQGGMRPCPWASCFWHLALSINERTGAIKEVFPDMEIWEMPETCALDLIERNPEGMTLEEVATQTNVVRERVRQLQVWAAREIKQTTPGRLLRELQAFASKEPAGKRRLPMIQDETDDEGEFSEEDGHASR